MTAFNDIGGVPANANRALLRDTLRDALALDGVLVSDWNAVAELRNHGVAGSDAEAARIGPARRRRHGHVEPALHERAAGARRARSRG